MKTSLRKSFIGVMACAIALATTSCHRSDTLLDTIPADAAMTLTVNGHNLASALDTRSHGGSLTTQQSLDRLLEHTSPLMRRRIATIVTSDAVDRSRMAAFIPAQPHPSAIVEQIGFDNGIIFTFYVDDLARLARELEATEAGKAGRFDAYTVGAMTLLADGRQAWLLAGKPDEAAAMAERQCDIADGKSAARIKNLGEWLADDDGIIRMAVSMKATGHTGWTLLSVGLDDNGRTLDIDANALDEDGHKLDLDRSLERIDTRMLQAVAPDDMLVAAIGLPSTIDWDGMTQYLGSILPLNFGQRALLAASASYLKRIDGTLLIAAGPASELSANATVAQEISFVIAIQLAKGKAEETLSDFVAMFGSLGIQLSRQGDAYVWEQPGVPPLTMQVENSNTLVVATRPIKQLGNDKVKELFKGNAFAFWADIPSGFASATYGGPGIDMKMELDDDFSMSFRLKGSDTPLVEQLATLADGVTPTDSITL